MNKLKKLTVSLFCTVTMFAVGSLLYNYYLDKQLTKLYKNGISAYYGLTEKDRGLSIQSLGIKDNNFMLFGSSELSSPVPQNPINMFPNSNSNFLVNIIGRGYTQDLHHLINFGSLGSNLHNKKIGIVVSLQWFYSEGGISDENFQANFSELQFYRFINNSSIDEKTKKYVSERIYRLTRNPDAEKNIPTLYAYLYSRENKVLHLGYYFLKPYYSFRQYYLETKDKARALSYLKTNNIPQLKSTQLYPINWDFETLKAEEMGKKSITNNNYFIEDSYYKKYLEPQMNNIKDIDKDIDLLNSYEFRDYETLLKVCNMLNIKPYIILMPVNGYFNDYIGIDKDKRAAFYEKAEGLAKQYNFKVLNLINKEYEPYFMIDSMHLGWKGWLYIDEKIAEYNKSY